MTKYSKEKLNQYLYALIGSHDLVNAWWDSPNKAFDGKSPNEVWDIEPDSVSAYIMREVSW